MAGPVSWETAERVAAWVASGRAPLGPQASRLDPGTEKRLRSDFEEFTARAEAMVVAETGLQPASGPPRGIVVDRAEWTRRNISSFRRLLDPVFERLGGAPLLGGLGARSAARRAPAPAPRWGSCSGGCRRPCSASTTCSSPRARTVATWSATW